MASTRVRLVTIISHQIADERIMAALEEMGVTGHTAWKARGTGHHGPHDAGFSSSGNQVFQVLAPPELAARILQWVEEDLSRVHPAIAYAQDVDAVPADRFGG